MGIIYLMIIVLKPRIHVCFDNNSQEPDKIHSLYI